VASVLETEPMRWLPWPSKSPSGIFAAANVLANMLEWAVLAERHNFARECRFVAHP